MKQSKIGVLGGIGPEATGTFYLKLIKKLQSDGLIRENSDFPQIFINSIPAPELIFDKIENTELEMYQQGLCELDKIKPDFIVMVCNTIHLFHEKLQSKVTTEIIDLRKVVHKKIKELKLSKVTIVGTPSTISLGLYKFEGINYLNPNKNEIKELSDAVFNFNKGIEKDLQKKKVEKIVRKYLSKGSQVILLACTEFAVMLDFLKIPKLNTIDIMVEHVIERFKMR
jgi:aspartate racemase